MHISDVHDYDADSEPKPQRGETMSDKWELRDLASDPIVHPMDVPEVYEEEEDEPDPLDDFEVECWCGAKGKVSELFEPLPARCGGSGFHECYCGGDLCVCHNHGEVECDGCEDCEGDLWDDDYE